MRRKDISVNDKTVNSSVVNPNWFCTLAGIGLEEFGPSSLGGKIAPQFMVATCYWKLI